MHDPKQLSRAEQSRAEQSRAEQSRAEQSRAEQANRVLVSRDPIGLSPLYYHSDENGLQYDSSLKALAERAGGRLSLSAEAVHSYLHHACVAAPLTPLEDFHSLPPGHRLVQDGGAVRPEKYWSIEDLPPIDGDPVPLIREKILSAVERTVGAGAVIGVPLSSGIDSGSIVCLLKHLGIPFTAFAVGYEGRPPSDERTKAVELAAHLGVPVVEIELNEAGLLEKFPDVVAALDVPIADPTSYAYYQLYSTMRDHGVTLCLSGAGGDELFWGLEWWRDSVRENEILMKHRRQGKPLSTTDFLTLLLPIDGFLNESLSDWAALLRPLRRQWPYAKAAVARINEALAKGQEHLLLYELLVNPYIKGTRLLPSFYTRNFYEKVRGRELSIAPIVNAAEDMGVQVTGAVFRSYLSENDLPQGGDIAKNVGLLEACPLLDVDLVETVIGLRRRHPDWKWGRKFWLKEALRGLVPDFVLDRRKKQGFEPPVLRWERALFERYGERLRDGALRRLGVLSDSGIEVLRQGPTPETGWLLSYSALVLEMWLEGMGF